MEPILEWTQEWYKRHCDGYWEHMFGVKIETLDNPGWTVEIDLTDTGLEEKPFEAVKYDHGDDYWMLCSIKEQKFNGAGDSFRLIEILECFRKWVES